MHGNQPKIKRDKCITLDFRKLSRMVKTVLVIYLHEMTEHDFLVLTFNINLHLSKEYTD